MIIKGSKTPSIIELATKNDEFVTLDDGYKYWWPDKLNGCVSAYQLRELADELDKLNEPWQQEIENYFNGENK